MIYLWFYTECTALMWQCRKTEGNERGVKIIPTFLRRHAKYKVSQRKIHIFLKGILTMMIIVYLSRVAKIQNSSS